MMKLARGEVSVEAETLSEIIALAKLVYEWRLHVRFLPEDNADEKPDAAPESTE